MDAALKKIAAGAEALDREPAFPSAAFDLLRDEGATAATLPGVEGRRIGPAGEWSLVRAVAEADGSRSAAQACRDFLVDAREALVARAIR